MNLSATQLRRAAEIKEKLESLNHDLAAILRGNERGNGMRPLASGDKRGHRKMSAAARAKIAVAQRARWKKLTAEGFSD